MTDGGEEPEEGQSPAPEPPGATAEAPPEDGEDGDADPDESTAEGAVDPASTDLESADRETTSPTSGNHDAADSGTPEPASMSGDRPATTPGDASGGSERAGSGPDEQDAGPVADSAVPDPEDIPPDVRKYDRFKKIDGGTYDRANEFLRERTYITAREWAIARLCADFRTETGVEMTKIGEHLPQLVPFMTDTYSPQAVNQARHAFEEKVRKAGATFLYGAMCDFFTAEELDDVMYEATEVAKFLLEVEGVELAVEEELAAEDRISSVMREVRESSAALRHDEVRCPECGHGFEASEGAHEAESAEGGGD